MPTENPDQGDQDQPTSDQPVEARFDEGQNVNVIEDPEQGQLFDEIDQNNSSINDKPTEVPSEPECTTSNPGSELFFFCLVATQRFAKNVPLISAKSRTRIAGNAQPVELW